MHYHGVDIETDRSPLEQQPEIQQHQVLCRSSPANAPPTQADAAQSSTAEEVREQLRALSGRLSAAQAALSSAEAASQTATQKASVSRSTAPSSTTTGWHHQSHLGRGVDAMTGSFIYTPTAVVNGPPKFASRSISKAPPPPASGKDLNLLRPRSSKPRLPTTYAQRYLHGPSAHSGSTPPSLRSSQGKSPAAHAPVAKADITTPKSVTSPNSGGKSPNSGGGKSPSEHAPLVPRRKSPPSDARKGGNSGPPTAYMSREDLKRLTRLGARCLGRNEAPGAESMSLQGHSGLKIEA